MISRPNSFILDLDGVFTDGKFYYSSEGKTLKAFGADDHDAITLLREFMEIVVVTADLKGFEISRRRIEDDMHLELNLVPAKERITWINGRFDPSTTIYMGDGIFDPIVFESVMYSICPANSSLNTKKFAKYICSEKGGEGAVAEACIHIAKHFFNLDLLSFDARDEEK